MDVLKLDDEVEVLVVFDVEDVLDVLDVTDVFVVYDDVVLLLLDVVATAERNGLVLPREFGLLVKQGLYFDRYLKTLAPDLNPFNDPRISLMSGKGESTSGSHSHDGA